MVCVGYLPKLGWGGGGGDSAAVTLVTPMLAETYNHFVSSSTFPFAGIICRQTRFKVRVRRTDTREVVGYASGAASQEQAEIHVKDYTGAQSSGGWVL
jgi:hypothetical protein